jgi:hypothetical protein
VSSISAGPDTASQADIETQRLFLLQVMGVQAYQPRFKLPGALPSVPGAWEAIADSAQETDAPGTPAVAATIAATETVAERRPVESALRAAEPDVPAAARPEPARQPAGRTASPAPAVTATGPARSTPAADGQPAFQVLLIPADKGLVVCNQIPSVSRPALGRDELQLLQNLLLWLGCKLQEGAAQRHFAWPLPGLRESEPGLAGRSLQGFLAQAQQEAGFTRVLMLGSSSAECLQSALGEATPSWQTWYTHSLSEMLAMPALKRSAWQSLQSLHAGLHK